MRGQIHTPFHFLPGNGMCYLSDRGLSANHNGSECFGKHENLFSLQKIEPRFLIQPMHSPVTILNMVPHLPYSNSEKTVTQYDLNTCRTGCLGTMIVEFKTFLKHHGFIPPPPPSKETMIKNSSQ